MRFENCTRRQLVSVVGLFGLMFWLVGCGDDRMPTAPVRGAVTFNGTPLTTGTVTFIPECGPYASGEIGPDGQYELTTYQDGDGAVLGSHRIMVSAVEVDPDFPEAKPLIPSKYSSDQTSGLTAEIKDEDNVVDLPLEGVMK